MEESTFLHDDAGTRGARAGSTGEAATDTRLNRKAAIKSLPPMVAGDPERLARFQREAQLLAALNHPNIAADGNELFFINCDGPTMMVVDVDRSDGIRFGTPKKLFALHAMLSNYGTFDFDISPDGQRLLILETVDNARPVAETITLVQGWKPGRHD